MFVDDVYLIGRVCDEGCGVGVCVWEGFEEGVLVGGLGEDCGGWVDVCKGWGVRDSYGVCVWSCLEMGEVRIKEKRLESWGWCRKSCDLEWGVVVELVCRINIL